MASFSVRCLFRWANRRGSDQTTYEERITLWAAESDDDAIAMAEAEAKAYATSNGVEYLNLCQCYAMFEEVAASKVEVFSLLRDSPLEPREYLRHYFVTGSERERDA
jgi:hypothetical protein